MNCNIYFFIETQKGYSQYPDNYSKVIIANIIAKTDRKKNLSQFAISMNGKLAYMTYQYRYSDSKCFGICCEYNNVVPTNFEYLFEFFDNIVQDILNKGEIIRYASTGSICPSIDYISDKIEFVNYCSSYISNHLNDKLAKYINLPSQNYTSEKKKVVVLAYDDDHTQLVDLLNTYDNVVISRDNPYVLGYANTLKKSSEKISQLETELAKINRQKKQYRMVVFLVLAVAGCLVALYSFNNNIQSLNGDLSQRKEEIKNLNKNLTIANAKIDKISFELSKKDQQIKVLQKESIKNKTTINSLNDLTKSQDSVINNLRSELSSVNNSLSSTNSELSKAQKNLSYYQNKVGKYMPLIVTDIEIANSYKGGTHETGFGGTIYSKNSMYLTPRIKYIGLVEGSRNILVKLFKPNGSLSTGNPSSETPKGYSYSSSAYIYEGENTRELSSWGNEKKGNWPKGTYKIEVWYNDRCLKAKSFTIY